MLTYKKKADAHEKNDQGMPYQQLVYGRGEQVALDSNEVSVAVPQN